MYSVYIRSLGCAVTCVPSAAIGTGLGKFDCYRYRSLCLRKLIFKHFTVWKFNILIYFVNKNMLRRFCNINCTTEYFLLWIENNRTCLIICCYVVDVVVSAAAAVIIFISENLLPTERSPKELQIYRYIQTHTYTHKHTH